MITIDPKAGTVTLTEQGVERVLPMSDPAAFEAVSHAWLRAGWEAKYVYGFSWLGRPIIQLPEDLIRIQEVLWRVKPDVIVETGVAHGGGLIFYASLCKAMGSGRVIGVDIEIRPHNRTAIESHPLFPLIDLIEGSSTAVDVVAKVVSNVKPKERVLVVLDSNHSKAHVLSELEAYAPLVSVGSYIVAMDGIMGEVAGASRTQPDWDWNNPKEAAIEFTNKNPAFQIAMPPFTFNEGTTSHQLTYWPSGYIQRIR